MSMAQPLEGKRIVIAGARKTEEMSAIIEKKGGVARIRSLQGTVFLAEKEIEAEMRRVVEQGADWMVFTTGIGLETLLAQADKTGLRDSFLNTVICSKIAARGYKTIAALKKLGLEADAVDDDGTTQGLINALQSVDLAGKRVVVQLHGEPVPALVGFLEEKGALVGQIMPYRHIPPEASVVEQLCREIADGSVDAVCFTTAVQVRYLFEHAKNHGCASQIREAFEAQVLAAAVGKVTAEALRDEGVKRLLSPENERMGAMIVELANYYE